MGVPKQRDIRNAQPELELFPEEATESPTDNAKIQQLHDYYSNAFHFASLLSVCLCGVFEL